MRARLGRPSDSGSPQPDYALLFLRFGLASTTCNQDDADHQSWSSMGLARYLSFGTVSPAPSRDHGRSSPRQWGDGYFFGFSQMVAALEKRHSGNGSLAGFGVYLCTEYFGSVGLGSQRKIEPSATNISQSLGGANPPRSADISTSDHHPRRVMSARGTTEIGPDWDERLPAPRKALPSSAYAVEKNPLTFLFGGKEGAKISLDGTEVGAPQRGWVHLKFIPMLIGFSWSLVRSPVPEQSTMLTLLSICLHLQYRARWNPRRKVFHHFFLGNHKRDMYISSMKEHLHARHLEVSLTGEFSAARTQAMSLAKGNCRYLLNSRYQHETGLGGDQSTTHSGFSGPRLGTRTQGGRLPDHATDAFEIPVGDDRRLHQVNVLVIVRIVVLSAIEPTKVVMDDRQVEQLIFTREVQCSECTDRYRKRPMPYPDTGTTGGHTNTKKSLDIPRHWRHLIGTKELDDFSFLPVDNRPLPGSLRRHDLRSTSDSEWVIAPRGSMGHTETQCHGRRFRAVAHQIEDLDFEFIPSHEATRLQPYHWDRTRIREASQQTPDFHPIEQPTKPGKKKKEGRFYNVITITPRYLLALN
ncbi:hypothetical protein ACRALDRAFT_2015605 [Sodiomyces alcalophilus JCM 7366]|uniref:uncharacterized protein n=1 Tax=Sodiomyces alcalophilus JCM 7366 TaxID=591952 RepID=UPI0039B61C39